MSQYYYSSLSLGPDSIRLLRLMPHGNESIERTEIQCELFEYTLQDPGKETHLYEALSYTWGGLGKPRSISINKQNLAVTENLHAALLRLQDRSFERILWIDAICINQENLKEQSQQVQLMAKIYSKATRVLVWLGETADNSDTALERIRIAAENGSPDSLNDKTIQQAILALLQRPWFRRVWVLQEVAAARHILIMCGSTGIDGYAFCLGVNHFYEAHRDLESSIRSITDLIRGAIFRPKHVMSWSRPLGVLIDMFHTHEATKPVDKVYALLGMSSDDPSTAGLLPDYKVPWEKLFKDLVKFLLSKQVYVTIWGDEERAVIESKGCILGQVLSVESGDRHKVNIIFKNMPKHLGCKREWHGLWTLQASVKHIWEGDIVCLLQGAPNPMIIRLCKDYFTVIRIAAFPEGKLTESGDIEWSKLLRSITAFPRDFLIIWNWKNSLEKLQDLGEFEALVQTDNWVSEHSKTGLGGYLDKATRTWNVAMILDDLEEYEKAEERLREAIEGYEIAFGEEHPHTLKSQYGRTPLSWAAGNGYDTVVDLLLVKDSIDPDLKDSQSGRAPLSWAAGGGHEAVVQLLLATGKVDVDAKDKAGWTPLLWAVKEGHEAVVQQLLATGKVDVDAKDKGGWTPLSWAAAGGHEAVVQLLLATGKVDVDAKDKFRGRTPLSFASYNGHEAVVQQLLATGKVDVDSKDNFNGRTPLFWAVREGHEAVVQQLLVTGKVDIDSKDKDGRTPLLWAVKEGHEAVVQQLLATGKVDVNSKDKDGWTPLFWAVREGHEAVVQRLLATGKADVNSKDNYGWTPLSLARKNSHENIIKLLAPLSIMGGGTQPYPQSID